MATHKSLNVLSLFDGISCGQQALKELGIKIGKYYASEIELTAIRVTQKRHPLTVQLGDIKWVKMYMKNAHIDLVLAGSPCQGFSFAGKRLNFKDPRSKLFFEFVDLLKICRKRNQRVKFLLENVRMDERSKKTIDKLLGVKGILINSRLFGAQNRPRYYWTNIEYDPVPKKESPKILRDVLDKPYHVHEDKIGRVTNKRMWSNQLTRVHNINVKSPCLMAASEYSVMVATSFKTCRILTPIEWERIQGLPPGYTNGIPDKMRYHAIGNGWHVPTIKHILKGLK